VDLPPPYFLLRTFSFEKLFLKGSPHPSIAPLKLLISFVALFWIGLSPFDPVLSIFVKCFISGSFRLFFFLPGNFFMGLRLRFFAFVHFYGSPFSQGSPCSDLFSELPGCIDFCFMSPPPFRLPVVEGLFFPPYPNCVAFPLRCVFACSFPDL